MISRLLGNYARQVALPWSKKLPRKQRVWFAVYEPDEERRVRAKLAQFETHTLEAKHGWHMVDLTGLLPEWIATHEYREAIFNEPELLSPNNELEDRAVERVSQACSAPSGPPKRRGIPSTRRDNTACRVSGATAGGRSSKAGSANSSASSTERPGRARMRGSNSARPPAAVRKASRKARAARRVGSSSV